MMGDEAAGPSYMMYQHYSANGGTENLADQLKGITAQSSELISRIAGLDQATNGAPDLVAFADLAAACEALKPELSKLARSKVTDVSIRAGGEEHRLRDAQHHLWDLARAGAALVPESSPASRRLRLDPTGVLSVLDEQLRQLRAAAFDDSASERKSLFW